jgi:homoserine O-acetyltransferase/O-succinyltransferase
MARNRCLWLFLMLLPIAGLAQQQQWAELGDCKLESGDTIRDCRIGYRTYGTLNAARSNAILWPTWFTGRTEDLAGFFGQGKLLDTSQYFVIAVDALGDGVSSSPSNSKVQPRMKFPRFTIGDMVNSQHRLVTEKLGIPHLRAVMGISMGGMQTFEWLTAYPDFMDIAIPIVGSPRLTTSDVLLWSAEAAAIRNDTDWKDGEYTVNPPMRAARLMHQYALETPSYRNWKTPPGSALHFLEESVGKPERMDANDWLRQLEAMLSQDVYKRYGGSQEAAARAVKAKVLVVAATQDHMVAPNEALRFAETLGVEPLLLTGNCGHMSTSCESQLMTAAIQTFLQTN